LTGEDYRRLLEDAASAHMNMLRVWGGGIYEDDRFYDLCDELGLCVWQDFMFACATYPTFDKAFLKNVEAEARDAVRRLRHHPSLVVWCGNNELEQGLVGEKWDDRRMSWKDYSRLFDELLPQVVRELDPDRDYWPSSPHSPLGDRHNYNNPECGDAHLWSVWHGKQPFEWYRTISPRFCSEFGFQSFPEPRTVRDYTETGDRNLTGFVMEHHQRSGSGNALIVHYLTDWFRLPSRFEGWLWVSQILQGLAIQYAVEHWRRNRPRTMGALYWQLNDCWPVASWSSIDWAGRWKALHYLARRFFAPILLSAVEDSERGIVDLHVTNDGGAVDGRLTWTLTTADGQAVTRGESEIRLPLAGSRRAVRLRFGEAMAEHGPRNLILWADLEVGGRTASSALATFARPKHFELTDPKIRVSVTNQRGGEYKVRLRARKPALWAWLEVEDTDARYSDNFLHLQPGREIAIAVQPERAMGVEEFRRRLRVRSLVDTWREEGTKGTKVTQGTKEPRKRNARETTGRKRA
jgi:beta-mannosidase